MRLNSAACIVILTALACSLALVGCGSPGAANVAPAARSHSYSAEPVVPDVRTPRYRLTGPYTHANLTVYLVHGAQSPHPKVMTLQEALDKKLAVVHETDNVGKLSIENRAADCDIFIHSGDIVKGGKQDRVLTTDLIVPRGTSRVAVESLCVEQSRWSKRGREDERSFSSSSDQAAGKNLKLAARSKKEQTVVWSEVQKNQDKLKKNVRTEVRSSASQSSYQLTLEHGAVKQKTEDYVRSLSPVAGRHGDTVGYVFAINGKINACELYASHELFLKFWPKLLKASAVEALTEYDGKPFGAVTNSDLVSLFSDVENAQEQVVTAGRTRIVTKETRDHILFDTHDTAATTPVLPMHRSYIRK